MTACFPGPSVVWSSPNVTPLQIALRCSASESRPLPGDAQLFFLTVAALFLWSPALQLRAHFCEFQLIPAELTGFSSCSCRDCHSDCCTPSVSSVVLVFLCFLFCLRCRAQPSCQSVFRMLGMPSPCQWFVMFQALSKDCHSPQCLVEIHANG